MQRLFKAIMTLVCFLPLPATATSSITPRWTHFGLRPLGMGNAYVAIADDFNALFYNPAGLARLKEWDGELLNPGLEYSRGFKELVEEFLDQNKKSGEESQSSLEKTLDLIDRNTGEDQHLAIQLVPHLIFPNFGFGIGIDFSLTAAWHRQITADLKFGPEIVAPISGAMNFLDDRLSVGASLKFRSRIGVNHEFSMEDIESLKANSKTDENTTSDQKELKDYILAGAGVGADIGILFTPIKPMEPTIGVSLMDAGGTKFTKFKVASASAEASVPERVLPSLNMGLSLKPIQIGSMYLLTSMDMHSINQPYSFSKKWQIGSEFGYRSFLKIQAGLYQGYLSSGIQLDVGLLNLRLVTYAVEFGEFAGTKENRRYAFQLKLLL